MKHFFQEDDLKNTFIIYCNLLLSRGTAAKEGKFLPPPFAFPQFIIAIILSPVPSPHPLNITSPPAYVRRCSRARGAEGSQRGGGDWEKSSHISGWLYLNEFGIVLLWSRWPWR